MKKTFKRDRKKVVAQKRVKQKIGLIDHRLN